VTSERLRALALAVLLSAVPPSGAVAAEAPSRVLFVGNSYLYYNDGLHNHVRRMLAELAGPEAPPLRFKLTTISGGHLDEQPLEHLLRPGALGITPPFEAVVLQGHSAAMLSDRARARFLEAARGHVARIRRLGMRPYLYETPAYVPPHRRASDDLADRIAAAYGAAGADLDVPVIPVGSAFAEAYRRRPDLPLHKAFDGSHPTLAGTYLAAAVVAATVFDADLDTVTYDYFGALDAADARFLRDVAGTVARSPTGAAGPGDEASP
jgi:hypothetical protein